ncbi:hypothetical protein [Mycobacterium sp.]|uniref:hypothetical protein n=1 Tax=Mycobacterium sp. TaxID=1785 RepID=UPI003F98B045
MVTLPISRQQAQWRASNGHDDIALADSPPGLAGAVDYVSRSVSVDASQLPVGDLDRLVVARRWELRGDSLVAEGHCRRCATPVDVQFSVAAYADHHCPRPSRAAVPAAGGWFTLRSAPDVSFRAPTVGDALSAAGCAAPRDMLLRLCTRGPLSSRAVRAIENALSRLAPTLRGDVAGTCPECSAPVLLDLDARELCMAELRFLAASVYDDVNLIASVYHWPQDVILDLPSARRRRYADMIAGRAHAELGVAVA